ncbi:hypothetical protein INT48_004282 [Thamnidium elegans]|uniref:C2H2-type domain-containing protein n=1 Tax=Thamnidium elegans TaxID=101142 RepID=A0A8H7SVE8_9FUNG|nr:hypothetical protein INT48_004282 [Thamnidium elegans]
MVPNSVPKRGRGRPRKDTPIKELQLIQSTKRKRKYTKRKIPIRCAISTRSRSDPSDIECNPKPSSSDKKEAQVKNQRLGRKKIVVEKEDQRRTIRNISLNSNDNNFRVKASVHKSRNAQESFSTFGNPVLLPEYRFQLPIQLEDTIHRDDGDIWNHYCNQCNIYHSSRKSFKKHLSTYHKTAPCLDKDYSDLYCAACATTLSTISKSNDGQTISISEADCMEDRYTCGVNSVHDTDDSTKPTRSSLSPYYQPTKLPSNNETPTPADSTLGSSTVAIPYVGPSTSTRSALGRLAEPILDNGLLTSIGTTLDPSEVKAELLPDTNDPNYFCRVCDKKYRNESAYHIHLIRIHGIREPSWRMKPILHPNIVPDIKHKDLFCAACELYFRSSKTFACHIAHVHNISFSNNEILKIRDDEKARWLENNTQKKRHRKPFNPLVLPCVKDPLFYCARCDRRIHGDDHKDDTDLSDDSIWCCLLCTKVLPDRDSYNAHIRLIHNFMLAPHSNINDFTCYLCKKEYLTTLDVANHLINVHGIQPAVKPENCNKLPPLLSLPLRSQVKTAAYYKGGKSSAVRNLPYECSVCGDRFSNKYELGCHKEDYHDFVFTYDSDKLFCNLCDGIFISKYTYKTHIKNVHLIDELPSVSNRESGTHYSTRQVRNTREVKEKNLTDVKVKKEASPNENALNLSKNAYCGICDLSYSTTVHYRLHCFKYHKSG